MHNPVQALHNAWHTFYIREQYHFIYWAPICLILGILFFFSFNVEPSFYWSIGLICLVTALFFTRRKNLGSHFTFWAVALFTVGFSSIQWHTWVRPPITTVPVKGYFSGTIKSVEQYDNTLRLHLTHLKHKRQALPDARINFKFSAKNKLKIIQLTPQDRVRFWANLTPPPQAVSPYMYDFQRRAFFYNIHYVGYGSLRSLRIQNNHEQALHFERYRLHLGRAIDQQFGATTAAVLKAITIGDKTSISKEMREAFSRSGLAHILAISGLHMSIVVGLVFLLFFKVLGILLWRYPYLETKKMAALMTLLIGWGYLQLAGNGIPALRAYIMTAFVMLGILLNRNAISLRALSMAAIIILMIYPYEVLFPSFQMSFAAVLGLVATWEALTRAPWYSKILAEKRLYLRMLYYFLGVVLTSFVASLATAPFSIWHFHQFSLIGVAANMLAIPLVTFIIMPLVMLYLLLGGLVVPLLSAALKALVVFAQFFSQFESFIFNISLKPTSFLWLMLAGGLWLALWQGRHRLLGTPFILIALLIPSEPRPIAIIPATNKNILVSKNGSTYVKRHNTYASNQWQESYAIKELKKLPPSQTVLIGDTLLFSFKGQPANSLHFEHPLLKSCGGINIYAAKPFAIITNAHLYGQRKWTSFNLKKCQRVLKAFQSKLSAQ